MSFSEPENLISPGLNNGLVRSGDPGRKSDRRNATKIVNNPSTGNVLAKADLCVEHMHTQEEPLPSSNTMSTIEN